jgi:hypothetical protein
MNNFKVIFFISIIIQSACSIDQYLQPQSILLQEADNMDTDLDNRVINPKLISIERQTEVCIDICIECFSDHSTLDKYQVIYSK